MSRFFIERPSFAIVVAIFIGLAGVMALPSLPVSQYPVVAPPQISVWAAYPGASATTLEESVTNVIEEELNGAKGLLYYESSSSSSGNAEITVTFEPGTNPDLAQVDVQNRIKKAEARLPAIVVNQGLQIEQANANFLMIYALNYKGDDTGKDVVALSDYTVRNINNEIRRVPGVGKVQYFDAEAAMRVWLDPQKLLGYGLSIDDVKAAIAKQNAQVPAGSFGSQPGNENRELTATIAVKGTLDTPEEFGDIVLLANSEGGSVTLADVARIEIGSENYNFSARKNGRKSVAGAIQLSPGANAVETANAVRARLTELSASFPNDIEYSIPFDTSQFVGVAIEEVLYTLIEAIVLVFLVMFLFLQNIRYTLIPSIVVPVCLLGTLSVMYLLGFSVNMMTMFGMVLAIGILVDDAIVVVENVERIMAEKGLSPRQATIEAMREVSGAIVGITLVLTAVFLPLGFMSGSVGVIYQQFSLSLAVSILFSGFLALSLTPALCTLLLKPDSHREDQAKRGFFGWFNRHFARLTERFNGLNSRLVKRSGRYMVIYLALIVVLALFYVRVPESFVPLEDTGIYIVDVQLPAGATKTRTSAVGEEIESFLKEREAVQSFTYLMGFGFSGTGQNAAMSYVTLKDWSERGSTETVSDEIAAFNATFGNSTRANIMAVNPPPIDGLGNAGGFSLRLQDRGGLGREALKKARDQLLYQANSSPIFAYAMMEGLKDAPQLRLDIDREKAEALGVSFDVINSAISTAYGSATVGDFVNSGRLQRVVIQADTDFRATPESILELSVPNQGGKLVPLRSFTTLDWEFGPVQIARYNGYPAFKISGNAAPGYTTGEAMDELEKIIAGLPEGIGYEWTGLSYQERFAGDQAPMLFALAILVVFLLLVALYESWSIPVAVMLIVPIGMLGSVLAVTVLGMSNDVYFKVGLITIIGLSAKNAILIVEFAISLQARGHSAWDAAVEAARLRFRPIIMTSLAFTLGVLPMALASSAGGASQRAIGTGVIGGMITATVLGVIFVPIFFVWVQRLRSSSKSSPGAGNPSQGEGVPATREEAVN